jgi:glycine C-acetyltransferase
MREEPHLLEQLWRNARRFKDQLMSLGFNTGETESPIIPIIVGDAQIATEFREMLLGENIYVQAFSYPVVALGKARLRTILSATHTPAELDNALEAIKKCGRKLGIIN